MRRPAGNFILLLILSAGTVANGQSTPSRDPTEFNGRSGVASVSSRGFASIIQPALPAVVNISSSKTLRAANSTPQGPFLNESFLRRLFGQQFGAQSSSSREMRVRSLGSGVVIRNDGYILTNDHVVASATEIKVALSDRREFDAKLVGVDSKTDLAVLKIDARDLKVLPQGDSSKLRVGDLAFAIGNPFGIGQTVTMGIVSATERGNIDIEKYEDFIQTDAAINPGNSGGALINARGELIGINTQILPSAGGGNQGIGFAIPINMARYVANQILKSGKVTRGSIGVIVQDITPALAQAFKLENVQGALISQVAVNGPAARAGIQRGDVVSAMNGEPIRDMNDLRVRLAMARPGTTAKLKLSRDGKEQELPVEIALLPEPPANPPKPLKNESAISGVQVQDLNSQMLRELGLPPEIQGVIVANIPDGSPAEAAGLNRGDVIQEVNRNPVANMNDFRKAVAAAESRQLLLLINRGGTTMFVALGGQ